MNRFESIINPLKWFMALLLVAVVAGCGGGGGGGSSSGPQSSAKAIPIYSLVGVAGTINEAAKTIAVTVPFGADVTALVATFTTTGASVNIGATVQVSGTTPNDFTTQKAYTVTAADGSTATYTVSVIVAANSAKAITDYSLAGVTGTINETAKTIAVTVPHGTNVTSLAAAFTTTGTGPVTVVATGVQYSGITTNDFTNPVAYTVTAFDTTTAIYNVTVTNATSYDKAITAYSLAGVAGKINETAKTISVIMPYGTNVTGLIAKFTTTGTGVKAGATAQAQVSGTTANDFTSAVTYTVTAFDTTSVTYTVTVAVAGNNAKAITAYSFVGFAGNPVTINEAAKTIAVTLPSGTNLTGLIATFTTTGTGVKVGTTVQVSGTTPNNFTTPKAYTVTASDTTTATYNVTVTLAAAAGPAAVKLLTAGNFAILANSAVTYNGTAGAAAVTGDVGISPNTSAAITGFLVAVDVTNDFATAAEVVSPGKIYAPDFTGGQPGSNGLTPAKMTAAQNDMVTAYNDAAYRPAGIGTFLDAGTGGNIDGLTLPPGVYTWATNANVTISTNVTLNGTSTDVWIFQIPGTLTMGSGATVTLGGTAKAKNIFWQVAGTGVTLGTTAHIEGVILSKTAITLDAGATANSRLLAQSAVTLGGTVTPPAP